MNDTELKATLRAQELLRRAQRRRALMAQIVNHLHLEHEEILPEEREACLQALDSLRRMNLRCEKMTTPNYWQRLWAAIWGR